MFEKTSGITVVQLGFEHVHEMTKVVTNKPLMLGFCEDLNLQGSKGKLL
jgi:hypothetical protein